MRQSDLFIQPKRPWNAGRLIGPKAPLKPKHIWAIRQQLKVGKRVRDLAMFNCALDSKLRACDLVRLRVSDVAPGGVLRLRSIVIQQKTGRPDFRLTFQVMPGGSRNESSDAPQRRAGGLQVNFDIDNLFDARREARLGDGTPAPGYGRDVQDPLGRTVRLTLQRRF